MEFPSGVVAPDKNTRPFGLDQGNGRTTKQTTFHARLYRTEPHDGNPR